MFSNSYYIKPFDILALWHFWTSSHVFSVSTRASLLVLWLVILCLVYFLFYVV